MKTILILDRLNLIYPKINNLIDTANLLLPKEDRRTGGYLTIMDGYKGQILTIIAVGHIPTEKQDKYLTCSVEKAFRLFGNLDHKTSWESHNDANMQYPGAIRGLGAIYSFSGHQGDVDEGISTSVFYLVEPIVKDALTNERAKKYFDYYYEEVSKRNQFIKPLLLEAKDLSKNDWI